MIKSRLGLILLIWTALIAKAAEPAKAVGRVERLAPGQLDAAGIHATASAGLFIGIAEFGNSELPKLRYTVDDAIRLADLFVNRLGLLPPENCQLALGGQPGDEASRERLAKLRERGITVTGAGKTELLHALRTVAERARDPQGLVVVSISTHGFEDRGVMYVMPTDGMWDELEETGIKIETFKNRLENSASPNKKLVIVDACREVPALNRGVNRAGVSVTEVFKEAKGFAVLTACGDHEVSWEDPELHQGVFTAQLCNAFDPGGAPADSQGLIRLSAVAEFAASQTERFVWQKRQVLQKPNYSGDESARNIPLAFDQDVAEQTIVVTQRKERVLGLLASAVVAGSEITPQTQTEITEAVKRKEGALLERLLQQLETLQVGTPVTREGVANFWAVRRGEYLVPPPKNGRTNSAAVPAAVPVTVAANSGAKPRLAIRTTFPRAYHWEEIDQQRLADGLASELNRPPFEIVTPDQAADYVLRVEGREALLTPREAKLGFLRVFGSFFPKASLGIAWHLETGRGVLVTNRLVQITREGTNSVHVPTDPQGRYNANELRLLLNQSPVMAESVQAAAAQIAREVLAVKLPDR